MFNKGLSGYSLVAHSRAAQSKRIDSSRILSAPSFCRTIERTTELLIIWFHQAFQVKRVASRAGTDDRQNISLTISCGRCERRLGSVLEAC